MVFLGATVFLLTTCPSETAERRGIVVSIVKIDGSRIQGELVAVRKDSILLQEENGPTSLIGIAQVKYMEKPKRSALVGAINGAIRYGFIGVVVGDLAAGKKAKEFWQNPSAFYGGAVGALFGAVMGGLRGAPTRAIETIEIQGYPREKIESVLFKLSRDARIRDWR